MDTICSDCVFAEWHGSKQVGCQFNRLEKFEKQGTTIIFEDDGEKQYGRIVGRICNTCRHPEAMTKIPTRQWMKSVRKAIMPRIAMAVYVDNNDDVFYAMQSIDSFYNQTLKPFEVILIYNIEGQDAPAEYAMLFKNRKYNIPWRIQTIKGMALPMQDELQPADYNRSIDLTVESDNMEAVYFTACRAGYEYPLNYIETIDKAINDELIRFVALLPDEAGNGIFVQRGLHKVLQGNRPMYGCHTIIDKLRTIAEEEGTGHMIKKFEELCSEN